LIFDNAFADAGAAAARHNIKLGNQIPVGIIAELDRKIDDGAPGTGSFQYSTWQSNAPVAPQAPAVNTANPHCVSTATAATAAWNAANGTTNCGGATFF